MLDSTKIRHPQASSSDRRCIDKIQARLLTHFLGPKVLGDQGNTARVIFRTSETDFDFEKRADKGIYLDGCRVVVVEPLSSGGRSPESPL